MRELKFRFWDKKNKIMHPVLSNPQLFTVPCYSDNEHTIIMQYIGKKDEAGKDIYEHDIVDCAFRGIGIVYFISCQFVLVSGKKWWQYAGRLIKPTVIGNIYENPELIPEHIILKDLEQYEC